MLFPMPGLNRDEILMLESCQNADDWRRVVNRIKLGREGSFPPDWKETVIYSGMYARVHTRISQSSFPPAPLLQDAITGLEL
jgi:hypothetical protein